MTQIIRTERGDTLAREMTTATGEDVDTAVERAIEERLSRVSRPLTELRQAEVDALFEWLARTPARDARSAGAIVGFDAHGLPSLW